MNAIDALALVLLVVTLLSGLRSGLLPQLGGLAGAILGGAVALLHLIDFDEPFGFSVVEAMACGTPVIAFDRGSMPELIIDGVTGSVVSDVASAAAAISQVGRLHRRTVRDVAVQRFSSDRMVDEYVAVYRHAIGEYHR